MNQGDHCNLLKRALRDRFDLRCFNHCTLTTAADAPKRSNLVLTGQMYHVTVQRAEEDLMVFVHPKFAWLLGLRVYEWDPDEEQRRFMVRSSRVTRLVFYGHCKHWVTPGDPVLVREKEWGDWVPSGDHHPHLPHGWGCFGGSCSGSEAYRHYEADTWSTPEQVVDVVGFLKEQHFDLQLGRFQDSLGLPLTPLSPHYAWGPSTRAFWEQFPFNKMNLIARRWYPTRHRALEQYER